MIKSILTAFFSALFDKVRDALGLNPERIAGRKEVETAVAKGEAKANEAALKASTDLAHKPVDDSLSDGSF